MNRDYLLGDKVRGLGEEELATVIEAHGSNVEVEFDDGDTGTYNVSWLERLNR